MTTVYLTDGWPFGIPTHVRPGSALPVARPTGPPIPRGPIPSGPRATTSLAVGKQQR